MTIGVILLFLRGNNAQNNNVQSNNARNNNSAWNAQPQTDNNMQITSRTDNESAVKISEKPTPTSIPVPTPKPAKNPKPTKTPKSTQPPTPKPSKKKNKIKQRKQKKKTRIQVIPKCFRIKKTRGILLNTRM